MANLTVSSGKVFKSLTDLANKPASRAGKKLDAKEVKAALDSFNWGDGKTTRTEVIAAKQEFQALKSAGKLTKDGEQAVNEWFSQVGVGQPGGFDFTRSADAFRNLRSFLQWNADSQKGATLTKDEATALLSVLGPAPSPARIAEVQQARDSLKATKKSREAQAVFTTWLGAHPMPTPAQPLTNLLKPLLKDVLWMSETDRPLIPVSLGTAPKASANIANAARKALGEGAKTPVEVRSFDETFANLTSNFDPGDPDSAKRAQKFAAVRDALKANLTELQVIRVGTIDIDVFVVGKDSTGKWVGVMSGVVET
jgi:hypothetical protein